MGANGARGPALTRKARFDNLGELLRDIALVGNLGFRVVQRGSGLVFETYEVQDLPPRSASTSATDSSPVSESPSPPPRPHESSWRARRRA